MDAPLPQTPEAAAKLRAGAGSHLEEQDEGQDKEEEEEEYEEQDEKQYEEQHEEQEEQHEEQSSTADPAVLHMSSLAVTLQSRK